MMALSVGTSTKQQKFIEIKFLVTVINYIFKIAIAFVKLRRILRIS